ncbi:MAG: methyl-accepting chemotaxis protein [Clostridia bacterium]|nr:methyl-accepting chemotaxis protein [Clostridia bacterium]
MKLNLFKQIALYVGVLILIVCIGLGITSYKLSSNSTIKEAEDSLLLLAAEGVARIEAAIQGHLNLMESIANRPGMMNMVWEEQQPILQNEFKRLANQGYLALGVVSPDGTTRYNDGAQANLGDREYVRKAFNGESNVSEVIISRVENTAVLMYAVPIRNEAGKVEGVLIARRPGDALKEITDQMGYGQQGYAYIIGASGTLMSHPNREFIMDQRNVNAEIENNTELKNWALAVQKIGQGNSGVAKYELNGSDIYMGLEVFPTSGWTLGVVATEAELLEPLGMLRNVMIIGSLVFILLGIGVAMVIGRLISAPINASSALAVTLAKGDLTQAVPEKYLNRSDEIGELARAMNTLGINLRNTIGEISASAQELAASSEEMSAIAQNSSANMEEVSASTEEISASLEEVSASAEEISASSQQMSASTGELVDSSKKGNQIAQQIEEKAKEIQQDVVKSQEKAMNIAGELDQRLKRSIERAQVVNEIANMANQIAGIADQTNLLALNAAIEAARAGEQGRGFAVVAEEVRKLATESTETVKNIQNLTSQVQESIKSLIEDSNELLKFMSSDVDQDYKKFFEVAQEYMRDAQLFFNQTTEASKMGEEVLSAVNEVASSINEVTYTIGQSAEGANQIARGTNDTAQAMIEVNAASERLAKMSEGLTQLIGQFKL